MYKQLLIIFAIIFILLSGCKKEQSPSIPAIDGQWQKLNYAGALTEEYLIFNASNKTVYSLSKEEDFDFRDYRKGVFNLKGNILEMSLNVTDLYEYSINNDTLTLKSAYYGTVTRALRSNLAPKSIDSWIKPATITAQITDSFSSYGMTISNGKIYSLLAMETKRMKIFDINTLSAVGSINFTNEYTACEFVGPYLFTARKLDEKLERISEIDGSVLATSGASGAFNYIRAMAFTGMNLNFTSGYNFFTYDVSSNLFSSKPGPGNIYDMAYYDGKLYTVDQGSNVIHRINPSSLKEEKSWRLENYRFYAIAFDGNNCWVQGTQSGNPFATFLKLELQ